MLLNRASLGPRLSKGKQTWVGILDYVLDASLQISLHENDTDDALVGAKPSESMDPVSVDVKVMFYNFNVDIQ